MSTQVGEVKDAFPGPYAETWNEHYKPSQCIRCQLAGELCKPCLWNCHVTMVVLPDSFKILHLSLSQLNGGSSSLGQRV